MLLNHWSSSDYLQLVTEKVTAFEREQRELSVVPFGQVSTTLTALLIVYDTICAQALCIGSEPANAPPCTMAGKSACSNSCTSSSACVCSDIFCNRLRCPSGSMSLYEARSMLGASAKTPNSLAVQLSARQGMAQPNSLSVQMHASHVTISTDVSIISPLVCRPWSGLLSWTEL